MGAAPDIDGAIREGRIVRKSSQLSPDSIEKTPGQCPAGPGVAKIRILFYK